MVHLTNLEKHYIHRLQKYIHNKLNFMIKMITLLYGRNMTVQTLRDITKLLNKVVKLNKIIYKFLRKTFLLYS